MHRKEVTTAAQTVVWSQFIAKASYRDLREKSIDHTSCTEIEEHQVIFSHSLQLCKDYQFPHLFSSRLASSAEFLTHS